MTAPSVVAGPPSGWVEATFERPNVAESASARIDSWSSWRSASGDAGFIAGCIATPIPGWVDDMRPAVEARTVALAGAASAKITGAPVDARAGAEGTFDLRAASNLSGPVIGSARTFVGFDTSRVFTCFATCASKARGGSNVGCEDAVRSATLAGSAPPPPASLALRAGTWGVHHPRETASLGAAILLVGGSIAIFSRRRPRSRALR